MGKFENTLIECSDIVDEYANTPQPSISDLILWKKQLIGKTTYLAAQEKHYEDQYLKTLITQKSKKQEGGRGFTDLVAEANAKIISPEHKLLKTMNEQFRSVGISIQQDIKVLSSERINSRYDGQV